MLYQKGKRIKIVDAFVFSTSAIWGYIPSQRKDYMPITAKLPKIVGIKILDGFFFFLVL